MKKLLYMAAAMMIAFSSCSDDDELKKLTPEPQPIPSGNLVFTASIDNEDSTRTILDGGSVKWVTGDIISINGKSYTGTPNDPATTATLPQSVRMLNRWAANTRLTTRLFSTMKVLRLSQHNRHTKPAR